MKTDAGQPGDPLSPAALGIEVIVVTRRTQSVRGGEDDRRISLPRVRFAEDRVSERPR